MNTSFSEILELLRDKFPFMEPQAYVQYGNGYIFNLVSKQDSFKNKIANFCFVNPDSRKVSNCLSYIYMMKDPKFAELWKTSRIAIKKKMAHSSVVNRFSGAFLQHYGIKGQSWGVRNGPPYPLSKSTRERVHKKYSIAKKRETTVDRGSSRMYRDAYDSIEKQSDLTSEEKIVKTSMLNKANEEISRKIIGDISEHRVFDDSHPPRMIRGPHSMDDDLARVNPKFDFNPGNNTLSATGNNCALCAFTYDLRRRGYDVTAKASVDGAQPRRLMKDIYKDAKLDVVSCDSWSDFFSDMPDAYPEGSRGILGLMDSETNSGHAVNFEIKNGKIMVIDGQCNDRHTAFSLSLLGSFDPAYVEVIRTDNLDVNLNQIHKVCNELKNGWERTADRYNPDWKKKMRGREPSLDEMCELIGIDPDFGF